MPTKTEELKLVISLTGNAAQEVANLKTQFSQLGSSQTKGSLEQFKRGHEEAAKRIKEMTELALGGERAMLGFVGKFGLAGAAVAAFGTVVVAGLHSLKEFAERMTDLGNRAKMMGVNGAVLKNIEEQLERIHVSTQTADKSVQGFQEALAEMYKVGSQRHQDLKNLAGSHAAEMEQSIQNVIRQKGVIAGMNEAMLQARKVRENALAEDSSQAGRTRAEAMYQNFLRFWGIDPEFALIGRLNETTQKQLDTFEEQNKVAKEFTANVVDFRHAVDDLTASLKTSFLTPDGTLNRIIKSLTREVTGQPSPESHTPAVGAPIGHGVGIPLGTGAGIELWNWLKGRGGGSKPQPLMGGAMPFYGVLSDAGDDSKRTLVDNTGELKKLNDYLTRQQMEALHPGSTGPGGVPGTGPGGAVPGGGFESGGNRYGTGFGSTGGVPGSAAQSAAEQKFGMPTFGTKPGGVLGAGSFDALTRGTPSRGVLGVQGADTGGMVGGIDRSSFQSELNAKPWLAQRLAWMVRGEVGNASHEQRMIQLESVFNRAQSRGISLEQALLDVSHRGGYYARDTYRGAPPSAAETDAFKKNLLDPVMAGSDVGTKKFGFLVTGNASQMGFAGRRAAAGVYSHYSWYTGKPGVGEMYVTEARDRSAELPRIAEDRATVDSKSIKTVKVDATGKVAVNIGGGQGDATLGSSGLFKPTSPDQPTQMATASKGRVDIPDSFEGAFARRAGD
jgi:hypothetical protein